MVLPTPKPPATTILVAIGRAGAVRLPGAATALVGLGAASGRRRPGGSVSETAESTQHPFQQSAVRAGPVPCPVPYTRIFPWSARSLSSTRTTPSGIFSSAAISATVRMRRQSSTMACISGMTRSASDAVGQLLALLGGFERGHEGLHQQHMAEAGASAGERVRADPGGFAVAAAYGEPSARRVGRSSGHSRSLGLQRFAQLAAEFGGQDVSGAADEQRHVVGHHAHVAVGGGRARRAASRR